MNRRPSFIQAPSYWQSKAVYDLVRLNRSLVSGRYGNILSPDLAIEFRAAMDACTRQFELPENLNVFERDLEVISGALK